MESLWYLAFSVGLGLFGAFIAGWTVTAYLHRTLTHKAVINTWLWHQIGRVLTFYFVFMKWWEWLQVHRKHHRYVDEWADEVYHDPHSPLAEMLARYKELYSYKKVKPTFIRWHMAKQFHHEAMLPDIVAGEYWLEGDRRNGGFLDDKVFAKPVYGAVVMGTVYCVATSFVGSWLFGVGGIFNRILLGMGGLLSLGLHIGLLLIIGGLINHDCHQWHERRGKAGFSCNLIWWAIIVLGEGAHFDHHLKPWMARFYYRHVVPVNSIVGKLGLWFAKKADIGYRGLQVLFLLHITAPNPEAQEKAVEMGHVPAESVSSGKEPAYT